MTMNDEDTQSGPGAGEKPPGDPAPEPHRPGGGDQDDTASAATTTEAGAAQDEAALLWPEREVQLADGRKVTVREMTWGQSLRLARHWRPLADGLFELIGDGNAERDIEPDEVAALLEDHGDDALELLAACSDLDRNQAEGVGLVDGQTLLITWLGVHLRFFARRRVVGRSVSEGMKRGVRVARTTAGRSAPSS